MPRLHNLNAFTKASPNLLGIADMTSHHVDGWHSRVFICDELQRGYSRDWVIKELERYGLAKYTSDASAANVMLAGIGGQTFPYYAGDGIHETKGELWTVTINGLHLLRELYGCRHGLSRDQELAVGVVGGGDRLDDGQIVPAHAYLGPIIGDPRLVWPCYTEQAELNSHSVCPKNPAKAVMVEHRHIDGLTVMREGQVLDWLDDMEQGEEENDEEWDDED